MYHHYSVDVHAKITKSAWERTLSLKDAKLGVMPKALTIWAAKLSEYAVVSALFLVLDSLLSQPDD